MRKYFAIVTKEATQIIRDLPGLGLLYLMPAMLLIVITLTQEKVMIGMDSRTRVIMVNSDHAALGDSIQQELDALPNIQLVMSETLEDAEKEVYNGRNQVLIFVPDSATEHLEILAWKHATDTCAAPGGELLTGIRLLFDPAIMKMYKDIMDFSLNMIVESTALNLYLETFTEAIQADISDQFEGFKSDLASFDFERELPDFPGREEVIMAIRSGIDDPSGDSTVIRMPGHLSGMDDLVDVEVGIAGGREHVIEYNIVRNNVPAFILFAMFFIVIPLAASIIHEKQEGTKNRLMTLPVSWFTLFMGKITVYLVVCLSQFILMVAIGRYLIPLICELPPLSLNVDLFALGAIAIASGLAAIGFGLVIGTFSSTFQQAGPIGSVLVVVLAVIGGVFVPSYMMPDLISKVSFISPLRWGADAFYSIFARNAGLGMVFKQFISLLAFFIITLILSFRAISNHS